VEMELEMEMESFRFQLHGDVYLGSYDVDKAVSFLCQVIMLTKDNLIYSDLMKTTWVYLIQIINQKGIFKCYDT
jgi:hypothetical protein